MEKEEGVKQVLHGPLHGKPMDLHLDPDDPRAASTREGGDAKQRRETEIKKADHDSVGCEA